VPAGKRKINPNPEGYYSPKKGVKVGEWRGHDHQLVRGRGGGWGRQNKGGGAEDGIRYGFPQVTNSRTPWGGSRPWGTL